MDRFSKVFCYFLSSLALFSGIMLLTRFHTFRHVLMIVSVTIVMARYPWTTIPADWRRFKIVHSICGDGSGPEGLFCVLEPGHPGDHKNFHSSGGCVGWPRRTEGR